MQILKALHLNVKIRPEPLAHAHTALVFMATSNDVKAVRHFLY
jgi:hypothetical protein